MCVCAQFTIHYFAIHNIRSQFQFLCVRFAPFRSVPRWAPLSTVIIMFHFAIQVFALRQVLLSQVRASEPVWE